MSASRINPYLSLLISIISVSFAAIFIRLSNAPFLIIGFYRLLFSIIILTPLFLLTKSWKKYSLIPKKSIFLIIGTGILLAVHFAFWFLSLEYTTIASSVILVNFNAIFVAVLAYLLLKEPLNRRRVLGILVAFGGIIIIASNDWIQSSNFFGDSLAIISAIAFAFYILAGRKIRQNLAILPYVFLLYSTCALTFFITCLFWNYPFFSYPPIEYLWFLALAIFPTLLGHTLYNWALKYLDAAVVGVSLLAEPFGAILLAIIIFGEIPSLLILAGGALILGGIYLTSKSGKTPLNLKC